MFGDGAPARRVQSAYGPCHELTGIPMECVLLVETDGAVGIITLNRPERRNAMSIQMTREIVGACLEAEADEAVRLARQRVESRAGEDPEARQRLETDPHSPPRFRVIGPVSAFPEFARFIERAANVTVVCQDILAFWSRQVRSLSRQAWRG